MQKTKLGISVGLLGAAVYFSGLFNGLLLITIMVGYVLLVEDNEWLRRTSVKAAVLYIIFALVSSIVGLIPDFITLISSFCEIFGGSFAIPFISSIVGFIVGALDFVKAVLFIILGLKSLNQGTIVIPMIDNLISKYM